MSGDLERRITARMILDSSGFNDGLQGINAGLRNVDGQLRNANAQVGTFGRSSENLGRIQEALSQKYELQAKKVETYSKAIEKTDAKMQQNIQNRDRLRTSLDSANTAHERAIQLYGRESTQAQSAAAAVDQLEQEYQQSEQAVEANARAIDRYENNLNRAEAQMTQTQGELNNINAELERSNNRWIQTGETLTNFGSKMQTVGKGMSSVGSNILKATAPLVGLGVASAKVAMDFDAQMSRVKAISGATGEEFEKLNKQALDLGKSTSFSAKETALGMENLASAGFTTNEIMEAMPGLLDLAASSGEDLASSSDIAASTLRGFGLEAEQAGHIADVLAKNAAATNAAVADTGEAMKYVAPVAAAMGLSLEEVTASIGIMADAGIKGLKIICTNYCGSVTEKLVA